MLLRLALSGPWLFGAVLAGGGVGPVLLMFGLAGMPASGASLLLNAEGVFTALLAWFVFKENFDRRIALGMLAIVAGALVLSWPGDAQFGNLWPALAVLGACLSWGIDNNLTRKVSLADAGWIAMVKGLAAGAVNLALAFSLGAALPALPVQYADYAAWQQEQQQGEAVAAELASWTAVLAGAPTRLELPADRPRAPSSGGRGAVLAISWDPDLQRDLRGFAAGEEATPFALLLAGFAALLARWTGQADFLVGVPVAGRDRAELENLIGFFVNTLVLRCDLHGEPTFRELLKRTRERLVHALAHQQLPFARLVEALAPEREAGQTPLVQVLFAFQRIAWRELRLPGVEEELVSWDNGTAKFDLTLAIEDDGESFRGSWELDRDRFDLPTIARWAEHAARGGLARRQVPAA